MGTIIKTLKKGVFSLILIMLITIPNLKVYSAIGNYSVSSSNLEANTLGNQQAEKYQAAAWWAAASAAICAAYAAGYVLGTVAHHAYNLFGETQQIAMVSVDYNSNDFSKFDN